MFFATAELVAAASCVAEYSLHLQHASDDLLELTMKLTQLHDALRELIVLSLWSSSTALSSGILHRNYVGGL